MIVDRVNAGLQRARQQGKRLGRPKVSDDIERKIKESRDKGLGMLKIARELGIGVSVVQRVVASTCQDVA